MCFHWGTRLVPLWHPVYVICAAESPGAGQNSDFDTFSRCKKSFAISLDCQSRAERRSCKPEAAVDAICALAAIHRCGICLGESFLWLKLVIPLSSQVWGKPLQARAAVLQHCPGREAVRADCPADSTAHAVTNSTWCCLGSSQTPHPQDMQDLSFVTCLTRPDPLLGGDLVVTRSSFLAPGGALKSLSLPDPSSPGHLFMSCC